MFSVTFNYPKISLQNYALNPKRISFKGNELKNDVFEKSNKSDYIDFPTDDIPELNSKTMRLLYSPQFAPKRRRSEFGQFVTTIIDKKTHKPVEAYVVKMPKDMRDTKYLKHESWGIYILNNKFYERVGVRDFDLDYKNGVIKPGYMESEEGNSEYAGIGLRCHQIAVERMMQEGFKTVEINSIPKAFPFHYKSGFRMIPKKTVLTGSEFSDFLAEWKWGTDLPMDVLKRNLVCEIKDGDFVVDSKTIENYRKECYLAGRVPQTSGQNMMSLQGEWLETWKKMAKSQPILLDD